MLVITVARKPLDGTVASNSMKWGTGGINIDATRIRTGEIGKSREDTIRTDRENWRITGGSTGNGASSTLGRWPANMILSHMHECQCLGSTKVKGNWTDTQPDRGSRPGGFGNVGAAKGDSKPNGPMYGGETIESWDCVQGCPVTALDGQSGVIKSSFRQGNRTSYQQGVVPFHGSRGVGVDQEEMRFNDTGGASRFFKQVT